MEQMLFRVAILDMYEGVANEGIRGIREILKDFCETHDLTLHLKQYDTRGHCEVPQVQDYDAYISTGGPGSPIDSDGSEWEKAYFGFVDSLIAHNSVQPEDKRPLFLICHSFQIFIRYYGLGKLTKRKSTSFGIFPVHKTAAGKAEPFFNELSDPIWAVDSRDYQITEPNKVAMALWGSEILCIEKMRPQVKLDRAIMAIRFNSEILGTQFHPEADLHGMLNYLHNPEKKRQIILTHGSEKYYDMLKRINDSDKIIHTRNTIIPNFLKQALDLKNQRIHHHA